ncbi:MAG: glycerol-3-phosphate 1-O-acyltransferase PlsY [Candidatus Cloacimonetes bacterium]|nr:glycerol-3-phosphate 1-O-acyltransferase PlsY [Candidatus Cloacimonadota bacterium]
MNQSIEIIFLIMAAYLLGSVPTGYLMGRVFCGVDIRQKGSGNIGATNTFRVLGMGYGIVTMILDIAKGMLAVKLLIWATLEPSPLILLLAGLAAILGHIFPIFLGFQGGKGVATAAGVFIILIPIPSLIALVTFLLVIAVSGIISLGSLSAITALLISVLVINIQNGFREAEYLIFVFVAFLVIFIRHRQNIRRFLQGEERKIKIKR